MSAELKKEYINVAKELKTEDGYDTTMQTIIELSKLVLNLEERIVKLEERR